MRAVDVDSNSSLKRYLENSNCEICVLGSVLGDFPVLCAVAGGKKEPAILITSGAHADEIAGVHAALRLLRELKTDHRLYVVPVRDPFGFEGYRANLQFALGANEPVSTASDVYHLLRRGTVLYEKATYMLSQVGDYVFAYDVGVDFPTSSVGRRIDILAKADTKLLEKLAAAKRVVAPWNLPMPRPHDCYKRGARGMLVTSSGFVGNFNRFFDIDDAPPEIRHLRNLFEDIKPGLVLDLHEGYGQGFYVYKPESSDAFTERIITALTSAVAEEGGRTSTPEELQPYWGPSLGAGRKYFGNGVFYSGVSTKSDFSKYCLGKSARALTFETGGANPEIWRTDMQVWAAFGAIKCWEAEQ